MPIVNQILSKTKKKLDLNDYFGEEAYITIKKLSLLTQRKMQYISLNSFSSKLGKELVKKMKENGKIDNDEAIDVLSQMELDTEATSKMLESTNNLEKLLFDCGLDEDDHNFTDENGQKIKLNYETIIQFANDELLTFISNSIKEFSEGFKLGEQIKTV